ncbi:MAG: ATP-binding protein [Chloroflexi bacterium]|nr:ATP-binding protein [Chloroflexota bacterium]
MHYRHLAELQADANLATQLLTSAFTLADASTIEPLRERFESTAGRIERSLAALEGSSLHDEVAPLFTRLVELGTGEESGFDLIEDELRLAEQQRGLLALNRDIAVDLVAEVDGLVNAAHASAQEATEASSEAIFTGSTLLLGISALSIAGAVLIAWLFVGRVLLRRLQRLSDWMLRMAGGDLEARVDIGGRDEVADMAAALEVFRRHALEVQRLNLVEKLADELQGKNEQLESVLADLRKAQDQIVTREKLAALGELTAGVAHEIRNPLNFVKNFSEASEELVDELKEILEEASEAIGDEDKEMIEEISQDLTGNMERIRSHGERADRIVNDMLMMGRGSAGAQATDINRLLEEHARLAYHSARGTDDEFQLDLKFDLDPEVGEIEVIPQDMGRVFLNMVSNAGYASNETRSEDRPSATDDFLPTLWLTTRRKEDRIVVSIRDNGTGIPPDVLDKIFNPFFTTKPTDQGTGLGLAISNDIVREHGGAIRVNTEVGEGTEMIVELPLTPSAALQEGAAESDGAAGSGVSMAGPMTTAPEAPPA